MKPAIHHIAERLASARSIRRWYRSASLALWLILYSSLSLQAQYTSIDNNSGLWTDNATWVGAVAPPVTGIDANIDIYGTVTRQGDLDYNKDTLHIHDTLIVYGNVTFGNAVEMFIDSGGVFIILGDYTSANKVSVSTGGTFAVLGDFFMQGSSNQGSFDNDGTIYIPNPVKVHDEDNYTDLACDNPDYYPDSCAYGNQEDLEDDPIWEIIEGGGYEIMPEGPIDLCDGDSYTLSIRDDADSYQWYLDGVPIPGATSFEYDASVSGDYTADVTVGTDTFNLAAVTVIVHPDPDPGIITSSGSLTRR